MLKVHLNSLCKIDSRYSDAHIITQIKNNLQVMVWTQGNSGQTSNRGDILNKLRFLKIHVFRTMLRERETLGTLKITT